MARTRILIVKDKAADGHCLHPCLDYPRLEVQVVECAADAIRLLSQQRFQAVLCDLVTPDRVGQEIRHFMRSQERGTPVIILTDDGNEADATDLTAEVFDILVKPVDRPTLLAAVRRALLRSALLSYESTSLSSAPPPPQFSNLVGSSAAMKEILWQMARVAAADTNVCLYGESGTGKELVARAIHYAGPRARHPLIVLDCAAIPDGLMESEMFGHVKGAFTSAVADREGIFQLADGGTLFLDEVGELPLPLQAKLLRVIQSREFRKVGGKHPIQVNVRLIAATNRDLRALVNEGKFREDLFYRLVVFPITLPPLRDRKEDIPLLVDHFIAKFNRSNKRQIRGVSARTLRTLFSYAWPGNIRELENCIVRAAVLADGDILDVTDLTQILHPLAAAALPPETGSLRSSLKDRERAIILKTLQSAQGNRTRAAELLGISLRSMFYKLKELEQDGNLPDLASSG